MVLALEQVFDQRIRREEEEGEEEAIFHKQNLEIVWAQLGSNSPRYFYRGTGELERQALEF